MVLTPYHVRITPKSDRSHDEVKLDLTKKELEARFLTPYYTGRPIVIAGKTIPVDDIDRMLITYTDENSKQLLPIVKADRAVSSVITLIPDEWYVADLGKDVTDEFITGPPSSQATTKTSGLTSKRIFIVHGKDEENKDIMKRLLTEFGLEPIILTEQPNRGRTLIEKLIDHTSDVGYVFVLMTPDDVGSLESDFRKFVNGLMKGFFPQLSSILSELNSVIRVRVRQNVIFEYGLCVGALGRGKVCPLVKGDIEIPSDILGSLYIPFNERVSEDECKKQVMRELEAAGYEIKKDRIREDAEELPFDLRGVLERHTDGKLLLKIPVDAISSKEALALFLYALHPTQMSSQEITKLLSSGWKTVKEFLIRARASELEHDGRLFVANGKYGLSEAGVQWVQSEVLTRLKRS